MTYSMKTFSRRALHAFMAILSRRALHALMAAALWAQACSASALAQTADTKQAFLARYRCPIAEMLRQVFEAPSAFKERDRYMVLSVAHVGQSYVQCMFAEGRTKLYCEASSGYYAEAADKPRRTFSSDETKAALDRLGFNTGSDQKNYPYERDFTGVPDFGEIATLMLLALHDGFGARAETPLRADAPFARKVRMDCNGDS